MNESITITLNKRIVAVMAFVMSLHVAVLALGSSTLEAWQRMHSQGRIADALQAPAPIRLRTIGIKNGSKRNSVLVVPKATASLRRPAPQAKPRPVAKSDPFKTAAAMNTPQRRQVPPRPAMRQDTVSTSRAAPGRDGPRAAAAARRASLQRFSQGVGAQSVQQVASNIQPGGQASMVNSPLLSKSAINMQVEVPEGVAADELNEYELMFYGFQKRMMEKYLSAIMLQVREFERKFPHKSLVPEGQHIMTGRVTFDSDGNIKQIKMVRWSQADGLQELFNEVLKAMDSVPNPPRPLWDKQGEFTVFYNLTVNNS